jgi:dTDP-4-dehydrorhamnose reductase
MMRTQPMHIVVTGAAGRLGGAMVAALGEAGHRVTGLTRADLDVSDESAVERRFDALRPDVIVNCTAYNAVDAAEANPSLAFAVNAHGPAALAEAATRLGAVLVHYSTDFVFDGTASEPYTEDALPRPLTVYGASKLAGEQEAAATPWHYILRVESLFGGTPPPAQRATVDFIADSLIAGASVRAIVDRTVTPSYVPDAVRATTGLLDTEAPSGIYHCVASESTTWYELANEIATFSGGVGQVIPVEVNEFATIAPRPRFCALSNQKLLTAGLHMPTWKVALRHHLTHRRTPARVAAAMRTKTA